jgi:hypothetical protein
MLRILRREAFDRHVAALQKLVNLAVAEKEPTS